MISSESSDEELETLHQASVAPRARSVTKKQKQQATKEKTSSSSTATAAGAKRAEPSPSAPVSGDVASDAADEPTREQKKEARKKRKLEQRAEAARAAQEQAASAARAERRARGRAWTLSMAIPGSIIDNAQTKELKTYLAGQVARAAVIFQVDEIVVFDDQLGAARLDGGKRASDCHVFLNRILQYLETPQYLRRALFPMHTDLSCAGLLNPLDCPHHLRSHEWSVYREGVVTDRPLKDKEGSHVHVGLQREVVVDKRIQPGIRVTVKIDEATKDHKKKSACCLLCVWLSLLER